jgi:hypothetical protein
LSGYAAKRNYAKTNYRKLARTTDNDVELDDSNLVNNPVDSDSEFENLNKDKGSSRAKMSRVSDFFFYLISISNDLYLWQTLLVMPLYLNACRACRACRARFHKNKTPSLSRINVSILRHLSKLLEKKNNPKTSPTIIIKVNSLFHK